MDANTILRAAIGRIDALITNARRDNPEHEPACTAHMAGVLEKIVVIAINARADARSKVEAAGGDGWWPVS